MNSVCEANLIVEWRLEGVVDHLLVEDGGQRPGSGRDKPNPLGWAATSQPVLRFQVFHELFCNRVVVNDRHVLLLLWS